MPKPALFTDPGTQRLVVAIVMAVLFAASLLAACLVGGARLGNPLAPVQQQQAPADPGAAGDRRP